MFVLIFGLQKNHHIYGFASRAEQNLDNDQGCSVLKNALIIKKMVNIHAIAKNSKTNIGNAIMPKNVEGKTAKAR
ncbi:MAG: hypothetical protein AAF639_35780, partial [Chloroflexota bacterium]